MSIPLPEMLRALRRREFENRLTPPRVRWGLAAWSALAKRPKLYHALTGLGVRLLGALGRKRGRFRYLPLAQGWTSVRDMPAPQGRTFLSRWQERSRGDGK